MPCGIGFLSGIGGLVNPVPGFGLGPPDPPKASLKSKPPVLEPAVGGGCPPKLGSKEPVVGEGGKKPVGDCPPKLGSKEPVGGGGKKVPVGGGTG